MKLYLAVGIALASLIEVVPLSAQQTRPLSLDEAIEIGLQRNKGLHSSMMRVEYADSRSGEIDAQLLPTVKLTGAYLRLSDVPPSQVSLPFSPQPITLSPSVLNNYSLKVTVQQPLFTGFKLSRTADIAEYTANATRQDFERDRSSLIFDIKQAYWSLLLATELENVVEENVEQMKLHLQDAQSLLEQRMTTTSEVLKVQVQLSEAKLRQIDTRNNVRLARIRLNSLLGVPLDTDIRPSTDARHEPRKYDDLPSLVLRAMERRPELKSMEWRVKAGEAAVSVARSSWFPQIYLTGNYYSSRPNQRWFPAQDAIKDSWDVGVAVSFDLWNSGATGHQTDQARAQLSQVEDGLELLKDEVTLDVTRNHLNLLRAEERITVAEQGVRQAEENYRVTSAKFKQGGSTSTDLLDAEIALLQAKMNHTESLVDYELAEADLERAIGRDERNHE